jgi:hypothetical protein
LVKWQTNRFRFCWSSSLECIEIFLKSNLFLKITYLDITTGLEVIFSTLLVTYPRSWSELPIPVLSIIINSMSNFSANSTIFEEGSPTFTILSKVSFYWKWQHFLAYSSLLRSLMSLHHLGIHLNHLSTLLHSEQKSWSVPHHWKSWLHH